jgi:hypothetical protein
MNLNWGQFAKKGRFENHISVLHKRAKNNTPMLFENAQNGKISIVPKFLHIGLPNISKSSSNLTANKRTVDKTFHLSRFANSANLLREIYNSGLGIPKRVVTSPANFLKFPLELSLSETERGTRYSMSLFLKDWDFGGKLATGQTVSPVWGLLGYWVDAGLSYTLNLPTATERGEFDFINTINTQIMDIVENRGMEFAEGITLVIGDQNPKTFHNIVGVNKQANVTGYSPKADLVFVQKNGNKLEDVAWFSHKDGYRANHFQQWGGVSHFVGKDETLDIFPEIRKFADYLRNWCGSGMQYDLSTAAGNGFTAMMDIEDTNLKMQSVYGKDFQPGRNFGFSNCTGVLQGDPSLIRIGDKYKLRMSAHAHINPYEMTGDYEPVLMLIKKDRNDLGIPRARIVVQPRASRTAKFIVTKDRKGNYELHEA